MTRVVVVTGANRGLGLEFCRQYLEKGDKVYACCRSPENAYDLQALKQASGDQLETISLDVGNQAQINNLPRVISGPVDILIHNAGIYGPRSLPFNEVEPEAWMEVFRINSIAPLMVVQALADKVAASQEQKIVLLSSKMGSVGDNDSGGSYIYRSSKSALNAVGKSLAIDLAEQGIKVAIVHPGWVQTDMGGPNAWIDAQTSISGLCEVVENLTSNNSGQFFNYDGSNIAW